MCESHVNVHDEGYLPERRVPPMALLQALYSRPLLFGFGFWGVLQAVKTYSLSEVPAKKMPGEGNRTTLDGLTGWIRESWMMSENP